MSTENVLVVSANMGLGHQRATYPLREIAADGIQLFGDNVLSSANEKKLWHLFQESYEFISRTRQLPLIGPSLFNLLEKLQNISPYYPFRDQSTPSLQLKPLYSLIKRGMGYGLCKKADAMKLPIVTSFYAAAIAAEELTDLPVYCIICDADINRAWVARDPKKSRIIYLVPCGHALKRLKQYGVPDERIFLTGFPLPDENIGGLGMPILRQDLSKRLVRLDPTRRFRIVHGEEAKHYLGDFWSMEDSHAPLTITYAVGGAGAQAEIADGVLSSLAPRILDGRMRLNLVAAHRPRVNEYFCKLFEKYSLSSCENARIIYNPDKMAYFEEFNKVMRNTDLLWTKPSELSFYCGLGLPIIIAPPIGPHEVFNRQWIRDLGAGFNQSEPKYCVEWIEDYLQEGMFAQAAWDGFLYARKLGVHKIREVLSTGTMDRDYSPIKR